MAKTAGVKCDEICKMLTYLLDDNITATTDFVKNEYVFVDSIEWAKIPIAIKRIEGRPLIETVVYIAGKFANFIPF